ncbi:hypothetical protein JCM19046_5087 [Bacillus sp. JCM 19046]|nr:hypothetical protein JCM19046_5087 [Bacillus sp. JCM 19046]
MNGFGFSSFDNFDITIASLVNGRAKVKKTRPLPKINWTKVSQATKALPVVPRIAPVMTTATFMLLPFGITNQY